METELVRMEHIGKEFPGVHALNDIRFELSRGEVHALVGENGAGKSTLMKVLTGIYQADKGSIYIRGKQTNISGVADAQRLGIVMIHQELNLMPHLSVAQNIFVGREVRSKSKLFLNDRILNQKTEELLLKLNLNIDPTVKVGALSVAKQQMVEITKALSYNSEILIMDEPTAALTDSEIEDLFRVIRVLREQGKGIVHISHRLDELKQISDRITVMRDGTYVDTVGTQDVKIDEIIRMMVGREVFITRPEVEANPDAPIALEVKGLTRKNIIKNVSFHVRRGEILGFAGLVGAGRTETARAVFGADAIDSGQIFINGKEVKIRTPNDAVRNGVAYLSEDRKRYGLALGLSVETNLAMADFKRFLAPAGFIRPRLLRENADAMVKKLNIKTPGTYQKVKYLSGGNQQKTVLGKWLTRDCDIIIFDEPTRGIDVGAKSEIYKLLNNLAADGKAIIIISSELPEILRTCHRVLVMCEGRITGELQSSEFSQESIMAYATKRGE